MKHNNRKTREAGGNFVLIGPDGANINYDAETGSSVSSPCLRSYEILTLPFSTRSESAIITCIP